MIRLAGTHRHTSKRHGKVLALVAVSLTAIFGMLGLVIDSAILIAEHRHCQNAADAASVAAACALAEGGTVSQASTRAEEFVISFNELPDAEVTVNCPPTSGAYAGQTDFVEVIVSAPVSTFFSLALGDNSSATVRTVSVAGVEAVPNNQSLVVLDPSPEPLSVLSVVPGIVAIPAILGGLEVEGLGRLIVDGAVAVNCEWGGVDENGESAAVGPGPPYAVAGTPLLGTSKLLAEDVKVTGGVDSVATVKHVDLSEPSPLRANQSPIADPYADLPVPVVSVDPINIDTTLRGSVTVATLPILPKVVLQPGIYDWIYIISGRVRFEPGIYIIRSTNPLTDVSLLVTGGQIEAEGVMFYFTDASAYDVVMGLPDALDGESEPAVPGVLNLVPSVVVVEGLSAMTWTGLDDSTSLFDGVLFFQRRHDRRPIVVVQQLSGGPHTWSGSVYAKWGHLMLAGTGTMEINAVVGTMRAAAIGDIRITPSEPLPPSFEVFLVE